MNLARPFKAGIEGANSCRVASATIESMFQPSLTRRGLVALAVIPALKGRAKFKPPLSGEEKAAQIPPTAASSPTLAKDIRMSSDLIW